MNRIIFRAEEIGEPIRRSDRRFRHIFRVLKARPGDCLNAGILNGNLGLIRIEHADKTCITYSFLPQGPPPSLLPITLICGLPRPQQVKRILRDCTSMGVARIWFPETELGEKSYRDSPIWDRRRWQRLVIDGLEQSGGTLMPDVRPFESLVSCLDEMDPGTPAIVLDRKDAASDSLKNYLEHWNSPESITIIAGSERGWTQTERVQMGSAGLRSLHMGQRILRTDTACIASVACVAAYLDENH